MSGETWSQEEKTQLLTLYRSRPQDVTRDVVAKEYAQMSKRSLDAVRNKLKMLVASEIIPVSRHEQWNKPPELEGDYLVMGDLHIPYHDAEFITRCIKLAKRWKINKLILGGDALDARAWSHWGEDFESDVKNTLSSALEEKLRELADDMPVKWRDRLYEQIENASIPEGSIGEELKESRAVLKAIDANFDEVLWMMGNHETWVIKMLGKAMPAAEFNRLLLDDGKKWTVSPYYWCRLVSNGEPFQIEHPKNSGKGVSKRFASKFDCNIIMLHNHHYSVQSDPSGRWLAVESGGCFDKTRIQYESQRHAAMDEHMTGAVIVRNGKVHLLNQFTDWDMLMGYEV